MNDENSNLPAMSGGTDMVISDPVVARQVAEAQGQMLIALQNPRNVMTVRNDILQACMRPGLALKALYSYSRGGTQITGPARTIQY